MLYILNSMLYILIVLMVVCPLVVWAAGVVAGKQDEIH